MKKVQHKRNINCHSKIQEKCTRKVHYSAQTDTGPLYTIEKEPL